MIRFILAVLLTFSVNAETLSVGKLTLIPGVDTNNSILTVSLKNNGKWFYSLSAIDNYQMYGITIEKHYIAAAGKRIYKYNANNVDYYLNFGLAATSKISLATSSRILFYEAIGLTYKNINIELSHTSNAGLMGANEGQTMVSVGYEF